MSADTQRQSTSNLVSDPDEEPKGVLFRKAPEVRDLAIEIIEADEAHTGKLATVPVIYIFRNKAKTRMGHVTWGTCRKISGLQALYARMMFSSYDMAQMTGFLNPREYVCFEVCIAYDIWEGLDEGWRRWLVRHELCHIGVDDEDNFATVPHDIELFFTDAEGMESLGLTPSEFKAKFRSIEQAALRAHMVHAEQEMQREKDREALRRSREKDEMKGQTSLFGPDDQSGDGVTAIEVDEDGTRVRYRDDFGNVASARASRLELGEDEASDQ